VGGGGTRARTWDPLIIAAQESLISGEIKGEAFSLFYFFEIWSDFRQVRAAKGHRHVSNEGAHDRGWQFYRFAGHGPDIDDVYPESDQKPGAMLLDKNWSVVALACVAVATHIAFPPEAVFCVDERHVRAASCACTTSKRCRVEVRQAAREHAGNFGANHPTQALWRSQGESYQLFGSIFSSEINNVLSGASNL